MNLAEQLRRCFEGRVCLMGLGNTGMGDDGFGVRLAETLSHRGVADDGIDPLRVGSGARVIVAGTEPERFISRAADGGCNHVIFLDAVEFGGAPGSAVFLDADGMAARFPQVSTHKLSLGLLARWVEAAGTARAWLLGVQPESLRPGAGLSAAVGDPIGLLAGLIAGSRTAANRKSEIGNPTS